MDLLIIAVLGTLAIAAASQLSDRIGVAPALILLAGGTAVGFLPFIPAVELDPQVVLEGILPPLLFSTAVSISTINFRRELAPVAVLAILLVALSAAGIGVFLTLLVPGLSLAWAIAMGAILSPTDAVAISIARRLGVSQRIITVLEGEGLLNDATALVVLSSAVSAATSGGVSVGGVLGGFALAVLVALGVDEVQQRLSLALSGGHTPGEQAAWAEGVLSGSSLLLLHSPALLKVCDTWVMGLSEESFTDVLPVVRRAFGGWERPERRALAEKVANLDGVDPMAEEEPDLTEFAVVLATVDEILESAR